jgi:hypothetical protein
MTTRRSEDLVVPASPADAPLPANVQDFAAPPRTPFVISRSAVLEMERRQRERAKEKAVTRHARRVGPA